MNDAIRERLSAYLDGALPDAERRAVELEISRSEEMRLELEALRAVSSAVKALPKEKLPAGFMARLEARRAREDAKPARDYFILPPAYRPLAFALSTAVVALVVWDRTVPHPDIVSPHVGWDSERVAVKSAAEAPASIDVSGKLSALSARSQSAGGAGAGDAFDAKKEDAAKPPAPSSTFGKHISAPGQPLGVREADGFGALAGGKGFAAPSAAAADALESDENKNNSFRARNEEERSAINERLYKGFEEEKKRMGIAKVMDKDAEEQNLPSGGRELMALQSSPEAPRLDRGASVGAVRGAARAKRSAPVVKAIVLKSAEALRAAWTAAGLPGEPPAVKFPEQMALFLTGPSGCGISDVQNRKKLIVVLYKDAGFDDPSARVRAVTFSPKPVVVKLAQ